MATITPIKPHTRIDNDIIDDMAHIGVYGYAVYSVIKRHLNQKTSQCNPSYATIARKIGIDRGTVIRYVKKLKALGLLSPDLRFKEDGSPTSNQYNFSPSAPRDESNKGSGTEPLPPVAENNQGGCTAPPEQSSTLNKKIRTITDVDLMLTKKQQTCPHPSSEIVFLPDNITICLDCYGLLDANLKLIEENAPAERVENERVCAA